MTFKPFYSTSEAAEVLGVSTATVFRAVDSGRLKSARTPGGHIRISGADLEAYARELGFLRAPRRVLLIEDDADERRRYEEWLADPAWEVKSGASGFEAGRLAASFKPDVLVIDILLIDRDGRAVARLIKADPELKDIRIIAVTGSRDPRVIEGMLASGAEAVLQKPLDKDHLRAAVEALVA